MGRAVAALVVAALAVAAPLAAQDVPASARPRPVLSAPRVGGELLAGAYAGYLGFYIGRFAGERIADLVQLEEEGGVRRGAVLTFAYSGAAFGTAAAVSGIGSLGDQTGEFGAALLGTGLGFVVAVGVNRLVFPGSEGGTPRARATRRLADAIEVLLPAIGATIAFNSTRRFER
jgi:hypothetical protein